MTICHCNLGGRLKGIIKYLLSCHSMMLKMTVIQSWSHIGTHYRFKFVSYVKTWICSKKMILLHHSQNLSSCSFLYYFAHLLIHFEMSYLTYKIFWLSIFEQRELDVYSPDSCCQKFFTKRFMKESGVAASIKSTSQCNGVPCLYLSKQCIDRQALLRSSI